jgi:hypothetical protein
MTEMTHKAQIPDNFIVAGPGHPLVVAGLRASINAFPV